LEFDRVTGNPTADVLWRKLMEDALWIAFGIGMLAFLAAGIIWVIINAPLIPIAVVLISAVIAVVVDALRRGDREHYFQPDTQNQIIIKAIAVYLSVLNWTRKLFGKSPIWLIPHDDSYSTVGISQSERDMVEQANRLAYEVRDALKHSPISDLKKSSFQLQANEVPHNIVDALWKLARLRRIAESINDHYDAQRQHKQEIEQMVSQLRKEMEYALVVLTSIPVSLVRVELAHGDISSDRLLSDLNESNKRLKDLSASYAETRAQMLS
jgi:hypothetical protein